MINYSMVSEDELLDKRIANKNCIKAFCSKYRRNKQALPRWSLFKYKTGAMFNDRLIDFVPTPAIFISWTIIILLLYDLLFLFRGFNNIDVVNETTGVLENDRSLPPLFSNTKEPDSDWFPLSFDMYSRTCDDFGISMVLT